ncbi:MAG TPA: hypothetical protein VFB78_01610 [Acidimicrobiales bacterium]|nr:hypothetical protein [Acidimicrobiales bacterium]
MRLNIALLVPVMIVSFVGMAAVLGEGVTLGNLIFGAIIAIGTAIVTLVTWRRRHAAGTRAEDVPEDRSRD